ncbi:MAG TPA: SGNH/GDSL hydrolase family protein [Candidatus Saccharimonadales bacterium]|nr:SGNH/GDSL hydrolase family protein [Candidatus Saccharimonadales bacterium]
MQILYVRPRCVKRLLLVGAALGLMVLIGAAFWAKVFATTAYGWTVPSSTAVRRVSDMSTTQDQPNFMVNLDCTALTYRLTNSSTMQNGCFTPTAFGMLDGDNETVIYNGTDEGVRLESSTPDEILEPWPNALSLVAFEPISTGGAYIGLFKNLPAVRQNRNAAGEVISEQITGRPDLFLDDPAGQHLVVNAQTAAFSADGSWLVVEDYNNSFVRINLASLSVTAFTTAFNNPIVQTSQVAVSDDGRFVAIENGVNDTFKVYDLSTCNGVQHDLAAQSCASYDYWPSVYQQIGGLRYIRRVRFLNDDVLSFEAGADAAGASGTYELSPIGDLRSLTGYLGLGDSYTSGEGAFDYVAGTDTDDNKCHLSVHSYPLLLTRDLFGGADGHSVACSGAVINDVGSGSGGYRGQVRGGLSYEELAGEGEVDGILADFSPGSLSQRRFVQHYQPRIASVSIGGNDIGFGDILQNCVEPHLTLKPDGQNCYNTYESREEILQLIDRTVPRWISLYKQLLGDDPAGRLYAIGYPSIAYSDGKCGLNVHLSKSEIEFSNQLIDYLNGDIRRAAQAAGVEYVDISQALDGHRLCEAAGYDIAVNGLTAGNDIGLAGIKVLGHESYHPNALGQQLIEQAILKQTDNLSVAADDSGEPAAPDSQALLAAPKSGAPIYTLLPDDQLTAASLQAGSKAQVKVDGVSAGLEANSSYAVRLGGPSGSVLATVSSDDQGNIEADFTVPAEAAAGGTTLDVTGSGQIGEPLDITQPVYITASPDDFDGDGVANADDSCPYAVNSGEDADGDGIDDSCDGQIGLPAGGSSGSGDSTGGSGQSDGSAEAGVGEVESTAGANAAAMAPQAAPQVTSVAALKTGVERSSAISSLAVTRPAGNGHGAVLGAARNQRSAAGNSQPAGKPAAVQLKTAAARASAWRYWYVCSGLAVGGALALLAIWRRHRQR